MKRKNHKKFFSVFLCLTMIFTMFNSVRFAKADDGGIALAEGGTDLPVKVTFDMLTINWTTRERVVAVVFDMGEGNEVLTSSLDKGAYTTTLNSYGEITAGTITDSGTFTVHCRNNNASGVKQNEANRFIEGIYANTVPEMLDPFSRDTRDPSAIPKSGRYVVIEMVFWPIALATAAATASDTLTYQQVYTVTQNKAFTTVDGRTIAPGSVTYNQGRRINDVIDRFEYETSTGTAMRLFTPDMHWDYKNNQKLPETEINNPLPIVILLHGMGQGSDNETHLRYFNNIFFAWPEIQKEYPAYVLMPTMSSSWGNTQFDNIKSVVDKLIQQGRVDPNRIYATGHSMGGIGTWNLAARLPGYFAAIAPISAAFAPSNNAAYTNLPIWEFATADDYRGSGGVPAAGNWRFSLNNYKNTVFPDNTMMFFKGMYYSNPGVYDANIAPNQLQKHAGWVPAYNLYGWKNLPEYQQYPYYRDALAQENGRLVDWMFSQNRVESNIAGLKRAVAGLDIVAGIKNGLTVKLDQALKLFANTKNDKSSEAIEVLNDFINQANSLRDEGVLTVEQAAELINAAEQTKLNILSKH